MQRLDPLVGEWTLDAAGVSGRVSFAWLEGRRFLIQRWSIDAPLPPDGIAIIGADPAGGGFVQHYFDSRGVHRTYAMTLEAGVWSLWRHDADFAQRFVGRFSPDGHAIAGAWERSDDGERWEHDFAMTYSRLP